MHLQRRSYGNRSITMLVLKNRTNHNNMYKAFAHCSLSTACHTVIRSWEKRAALLVCLVMSFVVEVSATSLNSTSFHNKYLTTLATNTAITT
jgi:hypothetical protein